MNTRLKEIRDYLGVYIPKDMIDVELSRTANELLKMLERVAGIVKEQQEATKLIDFSPPAKVLLNGFCNHLQAILEDKL